MKRRRSSSASDLSLDVLGEYERSEFGDDFVTDDESGKMPYDFLLSKNELHGDLETLAEELKRRTGGQAVAKVEEVRTRGLAREYAYTIGVRDAQDASATFYVAQTADSSGLAILVVSYEGDPGLFDIVLLHILWAATHLRDHPVSDSILPPRVLYVPVELAPLQNTIVLQSYDPTAIPKDLLPADLATPLPETMLDLRDVPFSGQFERALQTVLSVTFPVPSNTLTRRPSLVPLLETLENVGTQLQNSGVVPKGLTAEVFSARSQEDVSSLVEEIDMSNRDCGWHWDNFDVVSEPRDILLALTFPSSAADDNDGASRPLRRLRRSLAKRIAAYLHVSVPAHSSGAWPISINYSCTRGSHRQRGLSTVLRVWLVHSAFVINKRDGGTRVSQISSMVTSPYSARALENIGFVPDSFDEDLVLHPGPKSAAKFYKYASQKGYELQSGGCLAHRREKRRGRTYRTRRRRSKNRRVSKRRIGKLRM